VTRKPLSRCATGLAAALVLLLGVTTQASAVEKIIKYQVAPGADSSVIALPANTPVMVIGNQTGNPSNSSSDFGVLQMVISNDNGGLNWAGSSTADGPKFGFSGATGALIMSLDQNSLVNLTIQFVLNKKGGGGTFGMVIKNVGTGSAVGQVKLFY
jgi:hypothetical protein